ncbi:MAG: Undecaprenyl-phosphate 4-deoxy-4-formamido-L-arabinose transferase [Chroococcidiopsis cubana SAG 39.79]|uniref:Glycosyl transferase n=1 Tax=Chroococcidiopsis cubana SAG 39.79 TaxID=388085 RepID=A0AB37UK77_9CYAN|nr:glycosyltransferase family 2 protein [Chroococcidiopsis cubana]MDZ4873598.1 Undecaprenyl-phosphate 4-deoxy-4-formamido-L-arabinose transferase [Chroococcidiopsis cubana SAG 39.79]PSB66079.1 glycosyl transferase [Chroococcidiopsis cubana CCALA 043]RUT11775.1 glycosyl transferase [Chroococcidiopsis cubana SAG 39.79]
MKNKPSVSIIINNYNYDRFLAEAIDSALSQTYPHTEVIVVDDGSIDNSRNIIASYGERIIPILQENGKQAAAFNSGFAMSQGEIIIFLDSDDYLLPYTVERIVSIWKPHLAKVHYRLNVVDTFSQFLGYSCPQGALLSTGEVWRRLLEVGGYDSTPTSGNALSRKALEQVFPIPDEYKLTADDYLSISIPFYGEVAAIEEPLGVYRIHNSNQWALATVTGDRFHRFVRHDLQNYSLLLQKANELGYKLPKDLEQRAIGRLWSRIISLRLDPQNHPIPLDRPLSLVYQGIRSLWKYSHFNWQKRSIYSLWFIWVGFMPLALAKPAITWLYAPHFRPKAIAWIITKIQAQANRSKLFSSKA